MQCHRRPLRRKDFLDQEDLLARANAEDRRKLRLGGQAGLPDLVELPDAALEALDRLPDGRGPLDMELVINTTPLLI
jgi:hypothetical protein